MRILYVIICLNFGLINQAAAMDQGLARHVLTEINLARSEPRTYIGFLREFRGRFSGDSYHLQGSTTRVQSSEGRKAVDEAIRFLSRVKPQSPLTWSNGLAGAAAELAEEQGRSGGTGHTGRQSHGMQERIDRHGTWERQIAENIGYGPTDARNMVIQLIVDDGVPNRGHRKNIFSAAFDTAGVACGSHPQYGSMCVIDFAGGFRE